ncbi:MAG TPA: hypothetical protein VG734_12670 [Lacunisphaera sp.]|nr:hypothetical protein [Lacunisphaera sp.]
MRILRKLLPVLATVALVFPLGVALSAAARTTTRFVLAYNAADAPEPDAMAKELDISTETFRDRLAGLGVPFTVERRKNNIVVKVTSVAPEVVAKVRNALSHGWRIEFRRVHPQSPEDDIFAGRSATPRGYEAKNFTTVHEGREYPEVLWVKVGSEISARTIKRADCRPNATGHFDILLEFTKRGKDQLAALSSELAEAGKADGRGRRLAILLGGNVVAAPYLSEAIAGGEVAITGSFTEREALEMCNFLNAPVQFPSIVEEKAE